MGNDPAGPQDPRAENCRAVVVNGAGQVTGVELRYVAKPESKFELVRVELVDEAAAQGNTVATCVVLDANGVQTADTVYLAWPFPALGNVLRPGNPNGQHMITNGYNPPDLGPLALFVGDASGAPISDIVGGLGLPWKRHVCFRATWRERGSSTGGGDTGGSEGENGAALVRIAASAERAAAALERLAAHLGA